MDESVPVGFNGADVRLNVCRKLQDVACLAAESGAGIQEVSPGDKGGQQMADQLGRLVLNLEKAFSKTGEVMDRAMVVRQKDGAGSHGACKDFDVFFTQAGEEGLPAYGQWIYPQDQRRLAVIAGADPEHFLPAEMPLPSLSHPVGMVQDRQAGCVRGIGRGDTITPPDGGPQDAVDKALKSFRQAHDFQRIDRLVDGRRFRYPVEKEDLIETNGQGLVDKGVELFQRLPAEKGEAGVQILALSQDPVDQVHGQMPVGSYKGAFFRQLFEKKRDRQRISLQPAQGLDGGKAGCFMG